MDAPRLLYRFPRPPLSLSSSFNSLDPLRISAQYYTQLDNLCIGSSTTRPSLNITTHKSLLRRLENMTDTPNLPPPLDPREEPILGNLLEIREQLIALKQDRSTYVKSSDVLPLYDKVGAQVKLLNAIRAEKPQEDNRCQLSPCLKLRAYSV